MFYASARRTESALCSKPTKSDVDLLRDSQGILNFNSEVSDGALQFGMAEQELDRANVARPAVDQCCFGPAQ